MITKKDLKLIKNAEGIIGSKFKCTQNDTEIHFYHENGDVDNGEFWFGTINGIGGWTVIGKKDLFDVLNALDFEIKIK